MINESIVTMSVITQRGDSGETDLMYGRRVSKTHPRIVANGSLDELNAVLGVARTQARLEDFANLESRLSTLQNQLILAMCRESRKKSYSLGGPASSFVTLYFWNFY